MKFRNSAFYAGVEAFSRLMSLFSVRHPAEASTPGPRKSGVEAFSRLMSLFYVRRPAEASTSILRLVFGASLLALSLSACQPLPGLIALVTLTPTVTLTPLPTATLTASATATFTPTPTSTSTFTPTPTPTITPTPTAAYGEVRVIGYSAGGRPLEVAFFGNGPIHRMMVFGIHGGYEPNTIELADELIAHLGVHPELIPADVTLFLMRSLNPDGEALGYIPEGRANANFVDLNRNWDALWQEKPDRSGCWQGLILSTGASPASEPETQALAAFLFANQVDAVVSYHSAGQGIYAGGQPASDDSIMLAQLLSRVSGYLYPPIDAGCQYTGQLIDWAVNNNIAAVDVELPNKWETQFGINLQVMNAFLAWRR
jgi:hypothetical protein